LRLPAPRKNPENERALFAGQERKARPWGSSSSYPSAELLSASLSSIWKKTPEGKNPSAEERTVGKERYEHKRLGGGVFLRAQIEGYDAGKQENCKRDKGGGEADDARKRGLAGRIYRRETSLRTQVAKKGGTEEHCPLHWKLADGGTSAPRREGLHSGKNALG